MGVRGLGFQVRVLGFRIYLDEVDSPDEEVDVAHGAAAHAAINFNQPWPPARILQFHVEHALQSQMSGKMSPEGDIQGSNIEFERGRDGSKKFRAPNSM